MKDGLLAILLLGSVCAFGQNPLQKSTNLIRGNDVIVKQQVEYKSPGRSGENVLWNFSELSSINDSYQVNYQAYSDSTLVGREHRTLYRYNCQNDSLFLNEYESPTIKLKYSMPELQMVYPFGYKMNFKDYFYGEGSYSQRYRLLSKGMTETVADGVGMMILPSGDTLYSVTRVYSKKLFTEQKDLIQQQQTSYSDSLLTKDSIDRALRNDSILFQVDTYRWYADGYRYPIFEVIESSVCKSGKSLNYFKTAFYYSPDVHHYLEKDSCNMAILSAYPDENIKNKMKGDPSLQPDKKKEDETASLLNYNLYPSPVKTNLFLEMYIPYETEVDVILYNSQGKTEKMLHYDSDQNNFIAESINCSNYLPGVYFLQLKTTKESITEKVIKK